MTTTTEPGTRVVVTDADGNEHDAYALSQVETQGHDFPVIWVAFPGDGLRVPWPAESVRATDRTCRFTRVTESAYLIEGYVHWPLQPGGRRVAYAVADRWGWAVMVRRGRRIVTVDRADRPTPGAARARAVQLVAHQTAHWRPTG